MKCVMVMFDSLNRHMLPAYGCDWTHAPNFRRLAERTVTFDCSYVCSMPCMPARRDLHTGRPSFLHCPWGPLEPFDVSVPEILQQKGVYTHLASDHYHYWEDGGSTYHNRYSSWQFFRGQEGDPHIGQVADPVIPENLNQKGKRSDWVNREHVRTEGDFSQTQTFNAGLDFMERNHAEDNWFLQIECFDPHEPFCAHRRYRDLYPRTDEPDAPLFDWPAYDVVKETPDEVERCRLNYAALLAKCDASLGDILDSFDRLDLWKDTMLILWTDHGFLLGEHNAWAKNWPPMYEEMSHTPFFVSDPRHPDAAGQRRSALVQPAIDLGPTLLRFFGLEPPSTMLGHDLGPVLDDDSGVRDAAIFGYFGQHVNITDGRYTYYRLPEQADEFPAQVHTLMPTTLRGFKDGLERAELSAPLSFSRGMPVLRFPQGRKWQPRFPDSEPGHLLFDLEAAPGQKHPLHDDEVEARLCRRMSELMAACDAPADQFSRMGLARP